jgi:hypothetical protein
MTSFAEYGVKGTVLYSSPLKPRQTTVRITSLGASSATRLSHVNGNRCEADVLLGNYGNEFPRQNAVLMKQMKTAITLNKSFERIFV